ncbi:hypothetical protein F2Q69_00030043 [Brassica cretica]|uniref:Replication factor A C-terminal domain-containing protein n=1 Tax=Brassica cretica TaxID=69181 RepID=A0A8S9S605_BRACR|nr:hypothetical protein F2Q69_00030043 [Brassica cretica]
MFNMQKGCSTCKKDVQHVIHCYYLVVRISDKSKGEDKVLLFNNIAEKLIRRPAFELVQEAAQPHVVIFNDYESEED